VCPANMDLQASLPWKYQATCIVVERSAKHVFKKFLVVVLVCRSWRPRFAALPTQASLASNMNPDPYAVLGLPKDTSQADIKAAFRKLSLQWHPVRLVICVPGLIANANDFATRAGQECRSLGRGALQADCRGLCGPF